MPTAKGPAKADGRGERLKAVDCELRQRWPICLSFARWHKSDCECTDLRQPWSPIHAFGRPRLCLCIFASCQPVSRGSRLARSHSLFPIRGSTRSSLGAQTDAQDRKQAQTGCKHMLHRRLTDTKRIHSCLGQPRADGELASRLASSFVISAGRYRACRSS